MLDPNEERDYRNLVHRTKALDVSIGEELESLPTLVATGHVTVEQLLDLLQDTRFPRNQDWLVRCMAATKERIAPGVLERLYDDSDNWLLRWSIANTIYSTKNDVPDSWLLSRVHEKVLDRENEMLILTIGKRKIAAAVPTLLKLLQRSPLQVSEALQKIGNSSALPALRDALPGHNPEATKAITKAIASLVRRKECESVSTKC